MKKTFLMLAGLLLAGLPAFSAACAEEDIALKLSQRWDQIKYKTADKKARIAAYEQLIADAKALAAKQPDNPAPRVWAGITLATLGGEVGAMGGALSKVKEAKALLEEGLALHPKPELETSIHTTLGSLYYQVPGWPLGYGDEDKALEHLNKALELSPDGLDAHFWMASYLWDETRKYKEAADHFRKAIAAPARPGREIADAGRKAEAKTILAKVEKKIKH
ncbi:MAG: hypothetical protein R8L58_05850 [Mariprofundaceae bacterium]